MSTAIAPTASTPAPFLPPARPANGLRDRALIVGYDASDGAQAALRLAAALASDRGARPHLARALDVSSWPAPTPIPRMVHIATALLDGAVERERGDELRRELAASQNAAVDWPITVQTGTAASVIAQSAERVRAALILMGLRQHGTIDRVVRDGTTMRVMTSARCPVLALADPLEGLPRRIVIGMDFTHASVRAAGAALDVVARGGTLSLAYMRPWQVVADEATDGEALVHALGVDAAFARVRAILANDMDVALEPIIIEPAVDGGSTAAELQMLGDRVSADLIAVGSRRQTRLDRLLLGSVTRDLVHDGHRSLLVVPPGADEPASRE